MHFVGRIRWIVLMNKYAGMSFFYFKIMTLFCGPLKICESQPLIYTFTVSFLQINTKASLEFIACYYNNFCYLEFLMVLKVAIIHQSKLKTTYLCLFMV